MGVRSKFWGTAVFTAVFLLTEVDAQTTTSGALSGVVVDQTGAVIPEADIVVTDIAKGTAESAQTDAVGVYQFSFLRPGSYTLKVSHSGFQDERRSISIQVGPSITVNVTLTVAKTSSEII